MTSISLILISSLFFLNFPSSLTQVSFGRNWVRLGGTTMKADQFKRFVWPTQTPFYNSFVNSKNNVGNERLESLRKIWSRRRFSQPQLDVSPERESRNDNRMSEVFNGEDGPFIPGAIDTPAGFQPFRKRPPCFKIHRNYTRRGGEVDVISDC